MSIDYICDIIILIGAVCVALVNIYNFFAKPTSKFKSRKVKQTEEQIKKTIEEKMPEVFLQHDLETRNKYLADRQRYLLEIKNAVLEEAKDTLEEIKQINLEQSKIIKTLVDSSKDILRQKIMSIYYEYRDEKRLPIHKREALDELYKDYKKEGGNSYIDKYYNRMSDWETYDDE